MNNLGLAPGFPIIAAQFKVDEQKTSGLLNWTTLTLGLAVISAPGLNLYTG